MQKCSQPPHVSSTLEDPHAFTGSAIESDAYLSTLNPAQLKAVKHDPELPLQILAGPGSGKTKVLTSRIAHLILNRSFLPSSICAVTFTNKAANEMRERLTKLIGKKRTSELKMGTFHALCATFLRKYARAVGLDGNFTICDAEESKKLIAKILKPYQEYLSSKEITLKEGTVMSMISKAKAKGHSAAVYRKRIHGDGSKEKGAMDEINAIVAEIYESYEQTLRKNNSLDFDDLLLFGLKLFSSHAQAVSWCQHVLVDEFQDTNTTQYDLMRAIAVTNRITIVGDPDQSIYGWRSAEVENLAKMQKDFPSTVQIFLEENYRSTAAILRTSLAIVSEDKTRVQKSLHTSNPPGANPVLGAFQTEHEEAAFIASEIKRVIANMGGTLSWGDFAVLLRFNALSRTVESALQKEGIPSRILGGHKFFERLEIKDLLAYLQLVDNPSYDPAFVRAIGVPSRGVGEKTLVELAARATKLKLSQFEVAEKIYNGRIPDIKPPAKRKLEPFVKAVQKLRELASKQTSPADLIRRLLDLIDYEAHLKKTQQDWETRWENVQELITFATEAEVLAPQDSNVIVILDDDEENQAKEEADTPLRLFLQASMLSSEGDNQSEEDNKDKVTISTCHAAKGLEWPVVIVPSVEEGTFPFYRTEDVEEERRLLYVACTRAQSLLYLTYAARRKVAGDAHTKELSNFISAVTKRCPTSFSSALCFSEQIRSTVASVLGRVSPDEDEVKRRVAEFDHTQRLRDPPRSGQNQAQYNPVFSRPLDAARGSASNYSSNFVHPSYARDEHGAVEKVIAHSNAPFGRPLAGVSRARTSTSLQPSLHHSNYSALPPGSGKTGPASPAMCWSGDNMLQTSVPHGHTTPNAASTGSSTRFPKPPSYKAPATGISSNSAVGSPAVSLLVPAATRSTIPHIPPGAHRNQNIPPAGIPPVVAPLPPTNASRDGITSGTAQNGPSGVKRRLGMGRSGTGYSNKKFKVPT